MDKKTAIENAIKKQKEDHEREFERKVEGLVYEIGRTSQRLRELKAELVSTQYQEPELMGEFSD